MSIFDINNIAFELINWPVSYIEFIGTSFGLISVYYASRANVFTWPTGIVNVAALFILFYQIQLYADMVLQLYFLGVSLIGWRNWQKKRKDLPVSKTDRENRKKLIIVLLSGTALSWAIFKNIHILIPRLFSVPSAYPLADSFIFFASILATILLATKKVETWILWILINIVSIWLYFEKDIYFLAMEYIIFLAMACYGFYKWSLLIKDQQQAPVNPLIKA